MMGVRLHENMFIEHGLLAYEFRAMLFEQLSKMRLDEIQGFH